MKLTQGHYLKELRKNLNLSQNEVGGENYNKVKMSRFENGVSILTEEDSKILEKNINNKIIKTGHEEISYLYFYDHEKYEIMQKAKKFISSLDLSVKSNNYDEFNMLLDKFNNEFTRFDIPETKYIIFKVAGDYYRKQKEYHKCYLYYSRCVDNAIAANNHDSHIISKIDVYYVLILLGSPNEAITLLNEMIENNNLTNNHKYQIHHRIGYAHLRSERFDLALKEFETAELYVNKNNLSDVTDLLLQKALCYKKSDKSLLAIEILKNGLELLKRDLPLTKLSFIKNIISAYRKINDCDNMRIYMTKFVSVVNTIDEKDNSFIIAIYIDLFDDFIYLNDFKAANFYIQRAFHISSQQDNYFYQNQILKKIFELNKMLDDNDGITRLLPDIKALLTKYPSKVDNSSVVFPLFKHLLEVDQKDDHEEILTLITKGD